MRSKTPKESKKLKPGERGKLIASAVNRTCYRPQCKAPLFEKKDGHWVSAFDVAHIRDEKKTKENDSGIGHRYFPEEDMSLTARNQYANLILLCKTCHKLIDTVAPLDYSVELLHEWKEQAETDELRTRLTELFGDKVLSEKDWSEALLNGSAVRVVHSAAEQELEALDDRLSVSSSYQNGHLAMRISARDKPVSINWTFEGANICKLEHFLKKGQPISIPSKELQITGSDLFTKLLEQDSLMTVLPAAKPALLKLSFTWPDNEVDVFRLDDIAGSITHGSEFFVFDGSCFEGLFTVHIEAPISGDSEDDRFTFDIDLSNWQDVELQQLPYFDKLLAILLALEDDRMLSGVLEFSGKQLFEFKVDTEMYNVVEWGAFQFVDFTSAARIVAKYFDACVQFDADFEFSDTEHQSIYRLMNFIGYVQDPNKEFCFTASQIATEELFRSGSIAHRAISSEPSDLIEIIPAMDIQLFGQSLSIPKRASILGAISPRIVGEKPILGERYQIEWRKTDATVAQFYFESEERKVPELPQSS